MKSNTAKGCTIAAISFFVIALLLVFGIYSLFRVKRAKVIAERESVQAAHISSHAHPLSTPRGADVRFASNDIRLTPYQAGTPLTRNHFIIFRQDGSATDLAREAFRKAATGASVNWLVQVGNISERNGKLAGEVRIPWTHNDHNHTTTSYAQLPITFAPDQRDALLAVRVNDWITITGTLQFAGNNASIKEGRISSPR